MRLYRCKFSDHINYRKSDRYLRIESTVPCTAEIDDALH